MKHIISVNLCAFLPLRVLLDFFDNGDVLGNVDVLAAALAVAVALEDKVVDA